MDSIVNEKLSINSFVVLIASKIHFKKKKAKKNSFMVVNYDFFEVCV